MSLNACASLVERADPDRFRATMAAPVAARAVLFPLYALNVEVSRAPWVTQEAMIAEMRLQWWRDALEEIGGNDTPRRHEVVDALAAVLDQDGAAALDGLVAARRWDVYSDAFEDQAHFDDYINATAGNLMWTAARLLGAAEEPVVRDFAFGHGIANLLAAIPALEDRGRKPLMDGTVAGVQKLAVRGLQALDRAAANRRAVSPSASAAMLAGWRARPILQMAARTPAAVADGALQRGALRDSLRLLRVARGGWWR